MGVRWRERGDSGGGDRLPVSKETVERQLLSLGCVGHAHCRDKMHYKDLDLNKDSTRNCGLNQDVRMLSEVHTMPCFSWKRFSRGRHGGQLQSSGVEVSMIVSGTPGPNSKTKDKSHFKERRALTVRVVQNLTGRFVK